MKNVGEPGQVAGLLLVSKLIRGAVAKTEKPTQQEETVETKSTMTLDAAKEVLVNALHGSVFDYPENVRDEIEYKFVFTFNNDN